MSRAAECGANLRFYSGSSDFVSCYIRDRDDFLALRRKSPFSLTAVMMVGARVRDAGRLPSTAQTTCLDLVQKMGMMSMSYLKADVNSYEDPHPAGIAFKRGRCEGSQ